MTLALIATITALWLAIESALIVRHREYLRGIRQKADERRGV